MLHGQPQTLPSLFFFLKRIICDFDSFGGSGSGSTFAGGLASFTRLSGAIDATTSSCLHPKHHQAFCPFADMSMHPHASERCSACVHA